MAKDLLYRPNLGYDKDYYTEGKIPNQDINSEQSEIGTITKEEIIKNLINDIENKIKFLPDEIKKIYFPPYYGVKDEYDRVSDEYKEEDNKEEDDTNIDSDKDDPYWEIEDNDNNDNDLYPPLFDREDDLYIDIYDPLSDPVKIIKDNYYVNFIDIYEDYLNKINVSVTNYIMSTFDTVSHNKVNGQILDYSTKEIKNSELYHLSDFLIKSDISLSQVLRLHKKLFQIDEIILHVRGIRVSKEQMIRYNTIEEMEQKESLDSTNNIILKESRRVSEKKYEENLYSLYKYLNSSVILLDESLKTITKQNKAIVIINNKEERE